MRTAILLTMSAGMGLAQQAASPCQAEEKAVQRYKVLVQDKVVSQASLEGVQQALAQCQAHQAQLQALKAEESARQAALSDLRAGLRRTPDPAASLKQATGGLQTGLPDRWWKNSTTAQTLGLTADQQKKMDDVFQQYRLKLIDLNAALEKEEVTLEPLVAAEPLDESKIATQIDRVAQARAELEKANGRMLLGIRKQLTPEQWTKLNQIPK